jgi:ABC-type transport system involved in Fe-S cluster assembly fused permease/ATPase subunit
MHEKIPEPHNVVLTIRISLSIQQLQYSNLYASLVVVCCLVLYHLDCYALCASFNVAFKNLTKSSRSQAVKHTIPVERLFSSVDIFSAEDIHICATGGTIEFQDIHETKRT